MARWLSVAETSDLTGLKISTLRAYCRSDQSSLQRNVDFRVRRRRFGPYQSHHLEFSIQGTERLISGEYTVYPWHSSRPFRRFENRVTRPKRPGDHPEPSLPPHLDIANFPEQEKRMITRQQITQGLRWILDHPCTDPGCKCRYHDALPKIDELMCLRQLRERDARCTPRKSLG